MLTLRAAEMLTLRAAEMLTLRAAPNGSTTKTMRTSSEIAAVHARLDGEERWGALRRNARAARLDPAVAGEGGDPEAGSHRTWVQTPAERRAGTGAIAA
jgi:hypothetical protein